MSALLQVAELNAAYAATIDADRLEAWPDFFVESCLYKITSADNRKQLAFGGREGVRSPCTSGMPSARAHRNRASYAYHRC
jgi:hypothetical protein